MAHLICVCVGVSLFCFNLGIRNVCMELDKSRRNFDLDAAEPETLPKSETV